MDRILKYIVFSLMIVTIVGCNKTVENESNEELSRHDVYYVVGYDGTAEVDIQTGTAKSGGYLFISENLKDSLIVDNRKWDENRRCWINGNLLDDIIDFPTEAMQVGRYCGFDFFPEAYRFAFKVQINAYRLMTEEEYRDAGRVVNAMCKPSVNIQEFKFIVITSIFKI